MPEEKRKINAWIPVSLYNKLETAGYENITQALIKALERFFEDPEKDTKGSNEDITGSNENITGYIQDIEGYKQNIETLTTENIQLKEDLKGYLQDTEEYKKDLERIQKGYNQDITGYKESIKALNTEITRLKESLANSPDISEFFRLQVRSEELERHNQTLKEELNKAERDKEDLKATYNNYFLQVQTLINQKAIEAPGNKKKWYKFW